MNDTKEQPKAVDDGGPAFPGVEGEHGYGNATLKVDRNGETVFTYHNQGMTLRQWYAGMALQGMLMDNRNNGSLEAYAHNAFKMADAMIAEEKAPPL